MVIKPHHFMDIIKLYGGGIQVFVPDTDYGHDFYRAANEIIGNHRIQIKVTSGLMIYAGHAGSWAVTKHVRIVFHI